MKFVIIISGIIVSIVVFIIVYTYFNPKLEGIGEGIFVSAGMAVLFLLVLLRDLMKGGNNNE